MNVLGRSFSGAAGSYRWLALRMSTGLDATSNKPMPSLSGWITRDLLIILTVTAILLGLDSLYLMYPYWWVAAPVCFIAFVACFFLCYVVHEWGHYLGARFTGIKMPLAPYKGVTLGQFHIDDYSKRQFLWLSWGGDIGHVLVTLVAGYVYFEFPALVSAAFFTGGVAFTVQALSVDQPIIWRVTYGADILKTTQAGTTPALILKRTWQSWLAAILVLLVVIFLR